MRFNRDSIATALLTLLFFFVIVGWIGLIVVAVVHFVIKFW